jgi:hypothetical protein
MGDIIEFFVADVFQAFARSRQFLVNFDGFLGHYFVGLLRTSHQDEVGTGGEALVTIRIKAKPHHNGFATGFLLFLGVSHIAEVRTEVLLRQQGMLSEQGELLEIRGHMRCCGEARRGLPRNGSSLYSVERGEPGG